MIVQMDSETSDQSVWAIASEEVKLGCGDFDSNGNFYTAGDDSGLYIVRSGEVTGELLVGMYADESGDIMDMKVYNDYLYILTDFPRSSDLPDGFYRHEILDTDGNLGDYTILLQREEAEIFAEGTPSTFAISSDGNVYFGTDHDTDPIMVYHLSDGSHDIYYKGILPTSSQSLMEWGEGNYLYMIYRGDAWNVARIDMGMGSAPYYGRE